VNVINRAPITEQAIEATYEVRVTTDYDHLEAARELLESKLEIANYPIQEVNDVERGPHSIEVVATLVGNTAESTELDQVVAELGATPFIEHASWTVRTPE